MVCANGLEQQHTGQGGPTECMCFAAVMVIIVFLIIPSSSSSSSFCSLILPSHSLPVRPPSPHSVSH